MGKEGLNVDVQFTVLNPSGLMREAEPIALAPRISDLADKVVYCISQHVGGADIFLKRVADALPHYVPRIKAIHKRKATAYMTDDPELWDEIKKEADAVIYGCGA
jgi:hypothetical protein